jgi:periplasmic divalent cation tolerance protein
VVLTTAPDEAVARRLARTLVEERLAACGNVVPMAASIYRWKGALVEEPECLLILKTRAPRLAALFARLREIHPYSVPEILALPVERGHAPYLAWLAEETR